MPILLAQSGPHQRPEAAMSYLLCDGHLLAGALVAWSGRLLPLGVGEVPAPAAPRFHRILTSAERALTGKVIPTVG